MARFHFRGRRTNRAFDCGTHWRVRLDSDMGRNGTENIDSGKEKKTEDGGTQWHML